MMLGDPTIYSCPHCGKKMEGLNVISGNSFGAKYYSDGYASMPMMPKTPTISKCPGCQNFFWLEDTKSKSSYESLIDKIYNNYNEEDPENDLDWFQEDTTDETIEETLKKNKEKGDNQSLSPKQEKSDSREELPWIQFLNPEELEQAIEQNAYENDKEKEMYLRRELWHSINHQKRDGKEMFATEKHRLFWEKNLLRIIELLNPEEMNDLCTLAEIQRNLGQFDQCLETLKQIEGEDYHIFKETLTEECKKRNRWVVELKEEHL